MTHHQSRDMKKTQRDQIYKLDEIEDLTLFADESFDTQDVDLFEFTSESDSPLTRLKSIILSLDWEITDEILQELDNEVNSLQGQWAGDKIAEVYLQGLGKIGKYLLEKGAYSHPNSIKLLLTFFYNFEKIVSSQNITGDEISLLLKGDVRKFRILQYQINQLDERATAMTGDFAAADTVAPVAALNDAGPPAKDDLNKLLKAAILSLDWEVTDESLNHFTSHLTLFQQGMTGNKPALVLIQGLQALGEYIGEERAAAHPEAFTLLHSFTEALGQLSEPSALTQDQVQDLLVDQINRLNHLKMLIAGISPTPVDDTLIDGVVDEISGPLTDEEIAPPEPIPADPPAKETFLAEDFPIEPESGPKEEDLFTLDLGTEIDNLFSLETKPAMETADMQYPDEILPPEAIHPVDDELADDLIGASLNLKRGIMPALSGVDDTGGYNEDAEPLDLPAQSDLVEQLDMLFAEAAGEEKPKAAKESVSAKPDVFLSDTDDSDGVIAALSDAEAPADHDRLNDDASLPETYSLEIENTLDTFFADADEGSVKPAAADKDLSVDEIEQTLFFSKETGLQPALAESEEEKGFSDEDTLAALDISPVRDIEEKLDFFFGDTDEDQAIADQEGAASGSRKSAETAAAALGYDEESLSLLFGMDEEETDLAPALVDASLSEENADERTGGIAPAMMETEELPRKELEKQLDFFFDASEDDEEEPAKVSGDDLTMALEATLDERQPEESPPAMAALLASEETRQMHLAALGALLPGIVRSPSLKTIAETVPQMSALRQMAMPADQLAMVQMLQTVLDQLPRSPQTISGKTERLVNYLYKHLLAQSCSPKVLPEAVNQFTRWLQDMITSPAAPTAPARGKTPTDEMPENFPYTAKELYAELTELRAGIREEFAKLRQEMGQKE